MQPLGVAYIALRDLRITEIVKDEETGEPVMDEAGFPVTRLVVIPMGEPVPGAESWPNIDQLVWAGDIERQRDTESLESRVVELEARVAALEEKFVPPSQRVRKIVPSGPRKTRSTKEPA